MMTRFIPKVVSVPGVVELELERFLRRAVPFLFAIGCFAMQVWYLTAAAFTLENESGAMSQHFERVLDTWTYVALIVFVLWFLKGKVRWIASIHRSLHRGIFWGMTGFALFTSGLVARDLKEWTVPLGLELLREHYLKWWIVIGVVGVTLFLAPRLRFGRETRSG